MTGCLYVQIDMGAPLSLNSNIASLQAQRQLGVATSRLANSYEKLSSGQRINHASDDAASLAVADKLKAESRVGTVALRNVNDGISLLNLAEAGLQSQNNIIGRLKELAEQSANGTFSDKQRAGINKEYQALVQEFGRIGATVKFNNVNVLLGKSQTGNSQLQLQVGTDGKSNATISYKYTDFGYDSGSLIEGDGVNPCSIVTTLDNLVAQSGGNVLRRTIVDSNGVSHDVLIALQGVSGVIAAAAYIKADESNGSISSDPTKWVCVGLGISQDDGEYYNSSDPDLDLDRTAAVSNFTFGYGITIPSNDSSYGDGITGITLFNLKGGATAHTVENFRGVSSLPPSSVGSAGNNSSIIEGTGVETRYSSLSALAILDARQTQISGALGNVGAVQSRLQISSSLLGTVNTNVIAAESRIRDVDIASESASLIASRITQQIASQALAQANGQPALVLSLLHG